MRKKAITPSKQILDESHKEKTAYRGKIRNDRNFSPVWIKSFVSEDHYDLVKGIPLYESYRDHKQATNRLESALELVSNTSATKSKELEMILTRVEFYSGLTNSGGSGPRTMGVLFFSEHDQSPVDYSLNIIHEVSHKILNMIRLVSVLYQNSEEETLHSPLRNETRPLWGVIHSAFVLKRMADFASELASYNFFEKERETVERVKKMLKETIPLLHDVQWTPEGKLVFDYIRTAN